MHRGPRPSSAQHGIALIVVLWLTVLLAVIASGFAYSMRSEALAARNTMSLAQARAAADGAVERTAYELLRPRNLADVWRSDGQPHVWKDGEIEITATAVDESARVDLNSANEPLLRGVLQSAGGLDPDAAQRLLEAILDWRDPDELRRPNGAEAADYRAAGSSRAYEHALRKRRRAGARARGDARADGQARGQRDRLLRAAHHQSGDSIAQCPARGAGDHARTGRHLCRRPGRRAGKPAARSPANGSRRVGVRHDTCVAY
jgi:hypothetical protein